MVSSNTRQCLAVLASAVLVGVISPAPNDVPKQAARAVEEASVEADARAERQWPESVADKVTRRLSEVRTARYRAQRAAARSVRDLHLAHERVGRTRAALDGMREPPGSHPAQHALDAPIIGRHRAAVFEFLEARSEHEAVRSSLEAAEQAERRLVKELKVAAEVAEAELPVLERLAAEAAEEQRAAEERAAKQRAAERRAAKQRAAERREAEAREAKERETDDRAETAQRASRSGERTRPATGAVTSPYGMRAHPLTGETKLHSGTDFDEGDGQAYAAASGRVAAVTYDGGYGNMVTLDHGGGVQTRYAHLAAATVEVGQRVAAGKVIGRVGSTGNSTGPHLHFEVLVNDDFTDPEVWLNRRR